MALLQDYNAMLRMAVYENTGSHPDVGVTGFLGKDKAFNHKYCLHANDIRFSGANSWLVPFCMEFRCFK